MEQKGPAQLKRANRGTKALARRLTTEQKAEEESPEDRRARVYWIWCLDSEEKRELGEEEAPWPCTGVGVYKKMLREFVGVPGALERPPPHILVCMHVNEGLKHITYAFTSIDF